MREAKGMQKTRSRFYVLAALIACGVLLYFIPPSSLYFIPPCVFNFFTGLNCPFCGATRALHNAAHGRFAEAFTMNPAVLLAIPLLLLSFFKEGKTFRQRLPLYILLGLFAFGILRNIPAWRHMLPGGP